VNFRFNREEQLRVSSVTKPVDWIKIFIYGLLFIGIYYSTFSWLISHDWARDDYSYCYLIPLVVLYLVWEKRERLVEYPSLASWLGLILFLPGIILFWLGELGGEFFSIYVSFWFIVVGLSWLHLGWKKLKIIAFPLFIMLTMFPLPSFLYNKLTLNLKLISSQLGVAMMQIYGMSAYRDGNVIDIGFTQLQVVDACSGLRFLIPLLVLSILLAYFFRAALWKRAILVISSVPLSIITNSLRIAITGILYEVAGAKVAEGFFHGFSGWFIFMFSLGVLLLEMWVLQRIPPTGSSDSNEQTSDTDQNLQSDQTSNGDSASEAALTESLGSDTNEVNPRRTVSRSLRAFLKPPQFMVAFIILGSTLVLSQGVEFREKIPITKSFDFFPLEIGEWTGSRENMEQKFLDTLDLSDYVMINYQNKLGRSINFYTAYYESQRKGKSIHSPASCLPGGGWRFKQAGSTTLSTPGYRDGTIRVNRALMQKGDSRQLAYYWFFQRDRVLTNLYQLKIFAFWDALTKQRTDGALVRLITPVDEFEKIEEAEKRLQAFTGQILPILLEYLPGRE